MSDGITDAHRQSDYDKFKDDRWINYYSSKIEMLEQRLNTINKILSFLHKRRNERLVELKNKKGA